MADGRATHHGSWRRRTAVLARAAGLFALVALSLAPPIVAVTGEWRRLEPPGADTPSRIEGVTWIAGRYVAVGSSGSDPRPAVWTSPDAVTWERMRDIDDTGSGVMRDVATAAPGFLAVGSAGDDGAVWASESAADSWRRVLVASFLGAEMHAVEDTWAGTIAVGYDTDAGGAGIWRRDGDAWSQVPPSPDLEGVRLLGLETGSFDLLAVGEDVRDGSAAVLISTDGAAWTRVEELEHAGARLTDARWGPFTVVGTFLDDADAGYRRELIADDVSGGSSDEWRTAEFGAQRDAELTAIAFAGQSTVAVGFAPGTAEAVVFESVGAQRWDAVEAGDGVFDDGGMLDVVREGTGTDALVAVGWSGRSGPDGADARAAIWTTAGGRARAYETVVPAPFDVSTDVVVIATGLAVATGTALLVPFPAALFNSTLEANGAEVAAWFGGVRRRVGRVWSRLGRAPRDDVWQRPAGVGAFLLVSAVLYALLDPSIGLDWRSLWLVVGLLLGLVVTSFVFALPTAAYRWVTTRERPAIRVMPWTIAVAIGCVLLTRLTGFQPGYLYGLLIGLTFATELSVRDEGRATAWASAWVLALTGAAWLGLAAVRGAPDPTGPASTIAATALTTIVVAGLEGLVFGLLPVRFLPGEAIFAWSRRTWAVLFVLGAFGFLHVLVNPQSGYLADSARTPMLTIVLLFAIFGIVSVGLWAWFRFRPTPRAATG